MSCTGPRYLAVGIVGLVLGLLLSLFCLCAPYWRTAFFGFKEGLYFYCLDSAGCYRNDHFDNRTVTVGARIVQVIYPLTVLIACLSLTAAVVHACQRHRGTHVKPSYPTACVVLAVIAGFMSSITSTAYRIGVFNMEDGFNLGACTYLLYVLTPLMILGGILVHQSSKTLTGGVQSHVHGQPTCVILGNQNQQYQNMQQHQMTAWNVYPPPTGNPAVPHGAPQVAPYQYGPTSYTPAGHSGVQPVQPFQYGPPAYTPTDFAAPPDMAKYDGNGLKGGPPN